MRGTCELSTEVIASSRRGKDGTLLIEEKDIILASLSGSLGVAAILLVFLGFLLSALATSRASNVASAFHEARLKWLVSTCSIFLVVALVDAFLSFGWLRWWNAEEVLFDVATVLFGALILTLVSLGIQAIAAVVR